MPLDGEKILKRTVVFLHVHLLHSPSTHCDDTHIRFKDMMSFYDFLAFTAIGASLIHLVCDTPFFRYICSILMYKIALFSKEEIDTTYTVVDAGVYTEKWDGLNANYFLLRHNETGVIKRLVDTQNELVLDPEYIGMKETPFMDVMLVYESFERQDITDFFDEIWISRKSLTVEQALKICDFTYCSEVNRLEIDGMAFPITEEFSQTPLTELQDLIEQ